MQAAEQCNDGTPHAGAGARASCPTARRTPYARWRARPRGPRCCAHRRATWRTIRRRSGGCTRH
eukprot:2276774-Prymnesium_polylepis.1